jgi:hypothetical protein
VRKQHKAAENDIIRCSVTCTPCQILGQSNQEYKTGEACGMHGSKGKCIHSFGEKHGHTTVTRLGETTYLVSARFRFLCA